MTYIVVLCKSIYSRYDSDLEKSQGMLCLAAIWNICPASPKLFLTVTFPMIVIFGNTAGVGTDSLYQAWLTRAPLLNPNKCYPFCHLHVSKYLKQPAWVIWTLELLFYASMWQFEVVLQHLKYQIDGVVLVRHQEWHSEKVFSFPVKQF